MHASQASRGEAGVASGDDGPSTQEVGAARFQPQYGFPHRPVLERASLPEAGSFQPAPRPLPQALLRATGVGMNDNVGPAAGGNSMEKPAADEDASHAGIYSYSKEETRASDVLESHVWLEGFGLLTPPASGEAMLCATSVGMSDRVEPAAGGYSMEKPAVDEDASRAGI